MKIGATVVLTEDVLVVDNLGPDFLIRGTKGTVIAESDGTLTLAVGKNTYTDIPALSIQELDAA